MSSKQLEYAFRVQKRNLDTCRAFGVTKVELNIGAMRMGEVILESVRNRKTCRAESHLRLFAFLG